MKRIKLKKIMAGPDGSRQPGFRDVSDEEAAAICENPEVAELVDIEEVPETEAAPEPDPEPEPETIETTEASTEDREETVKPRRKTKTRKRRG